MINDILMASAVDDIRLPPVLWRDPLVQRQGMRAVNGLISGAMYQKNRSTDPADALEVWEGIAEGVPVDE